MIFTASEHSKLVREVEFISIRGRQVVTNETNRAKMPKRPGHWGAGWIESYWPSFKRLELGPGGLPIIRRRYGLIRWFK